MLFDFDVLAPQNRYKLLVSTIVPRPIAWVVTQDPAGVLNAAPFSFFNAVSGNPPIVVLGIGSHRPGVAKDTSANIRATGEFVVNLVSEETAAAMNISAIEFPPDVDEVTQAGLTTLPSAKVKPPRIAESPVALECRLHDAIALNQDNTLILGRIVAMHVRDEAVLSREQCYIDTPSLKLIGRLHGRGWYARLSDQFEMPRIKLEDWNGPD